MSYLIKDATPERLINPSDDAHTTLAALLAIEIIRGPQIDFIRDAGHQNMMRVPVDTSKGRGVLAKATGRWVQTKSELSPQVRPDEGVFSITHYSEIAEAVRVVLLSAEFASSPDVENLKNAWKAAFVGTQWSNPGESPRTNWPDRLINRLKSNFRYSVPDQTDSAPYRSSLFPEEVFNRLDQSQQDSVSFLLVAWFLTDVYR